VSGWIHPVTPAGGDKVLDYGLVDIDNHFYEPRDSFTRFIDAANLHRAVRPVTRDDGREVIMAGGRAITFIEPSIYDEVGRPGSLREMLAKMKGGGSEGDEYLWTEVKPEYRNRDARLAVMDAQGVEACVLFPSVALVAEHFFDDPDDLYLNFHSFNRYLHEEWGFAYRDRIHPVPAISLRDLDRAVAELEWLRDEGTRVVGMRPGPAYGRSPADPYFDPFWARVEEAGISVVFHMTESSYNEQVSTLWGHEPNPSDFGMSAWQWANTYGDRPIMDTLSALVYDNLFGRFPDLCVASVENGCEWMPYLLRRMDKMRGMGRNGPWIGGPLTERPSTIFRRHVLVTPFPEDDVVAVVDALGVDSLVLGSDWPHAEGLAEPADYLRVLEGLSDADQRTVLRDNGLRVLAGSRR
jgi:predicted TIM-barrel fold metal-dependent hydrolase